MHSGVPALTPPRACRAGDGEAEPRSGFSGPARRVAPPPPSSNGSGRGLALRPAPPRLPEQRPLAAPPANSSAACKSPEGGAHLVAEDWALAAGVSGPAGRGGAGTPLAGGAGDAPRGVPSPGRAERGAELPARPSRPAPRPARSAPLLSPPRPARSAPRPVPLGPVPLGPARFTPLPAQSRPARPHRLRPAPGAAGRGRTPLRSRSGASPRPRPRPRPTLRRSWGGPRKDREKAPRAGSKSRVFPHGRGGARPGALPAFLPTWLRGAGQCQLRLRAQRDRAAGPHGADVPRHRFRRPRSFPPRRLNEANSTGAAPSGERCGP